MLSSGETLRLFFYGNSDTLPSWQPLVNRPPDCHRARASVTELLPANRRFREVSLEGASDPDGDTVSITIEGVTQDEPVRARGDQTRPDAHGSGDSVVRLRAERNPHGDGRVYRIAFTASDGRGGNCEGEVAIGVPRHKGKPAVDSAPPSFDSFAS
jgi:hypothetical protein